MNFPRIPVSPESSTTSLLLPSASPSRRVPPSNPSHTAGRPSPSPEPSISDKFSLSPDPHDWGAAVGYNVREPDDFLHNPDPKRDRIHDNGGSFLTARGLANLGCITILLVALVGVFAGYPVASHLLSHTLSTNGGFNLGGTNETGQIPSMTGNWGIIDLDTPKEAYTYPAFLDGSEMELVFSDEFNDDGRSFYPGDDPYWEVIDLHYWQTGNLEWYSPEAITTKNGSLQITLSKKETHNLNYQVLFYRGLVLASVNLPGANNVLGLWPGTLDSYQVLMTMGNLGRAGYGASLEGMWPYSYDSCDVGTAPNQTLNGLPIAATENGDPGNNNALSYLPGQRLSRCTCAGESHPGPVHTDGTYVGRSAPELDLFEAQISNGVGYVSQSGQWAPFDDEYTWLNNSANLVIYNESITLLNSYKGGAYQQATSCVTETVQNCYQLNGTCFATYGVEYKPGFDTAYITWINNAEAAWTLNVAGMGADKTVEIAARPVPQEPMYLLMNLGMSTNFGPVDVEHLKFPAVMSVDWVRVYQRSDSVNVGCNPKDFPTASYINAYTNPNLTTWRDDYKQPFPKSSFLGQC
ncbi:beta-glucan synthesis-associated [Rhodocollybia butyracea]|uniref:Beta-glucan synthesis-associated n=1 Tax=Rhodocollybia butyracea TaxID=206335 RepID=A0A9P5QAV3_9AGAR|nr:beta-glucan synthesis-associated [Rhodocollybia butyracea]